MRSALQARDAGRVVTGLCGGGSAALTKCGRNKGNSCELSVLLHEEIELSWLSKLVCEVRRVSINRGARIWEPLLTVSAIVIASTAVFVSAFLSPQQVFRTEQRQVGYLFC